MIYVQLLRAKAMQRCNLIFRSFQSNNIWTLLKAYTTYVRPTLEYGSSIWNPQLKKNVDCIERVQKNFTKRACYRCKIPFSTYSDRLYKLNLKSLEYRRLNTDLINTFKITHNLLEITTPNFFLPISKKYCTRTHQYQLKLSCNLTQHEKNSFSNRIVSVWNKLPNQLFVPDTLPAFKAKLNQYDLTKLTDLRF